jgi:hypothetical protein
MTSPKGSSLPKALTVTGTGLVVWMGVGGVAGFFACCVINTYAATPPAARIAIKAKPASHLRLGFSIGFSSGSSPVVDFSVTIDIVACPFTYFELIELKIRNCSGVQKHKGFFPKSQQFQTMKKPWFGKKISPVIMLITTCVKTRYFLLFYYTRPFGMIQS